MSALVRTSASLGCVAKMIVILPVGIDSLSKKLALSLTNALGCSFYSKEPPFVKSEIAV